MNQKMEKIIYGASIVVLVAIVLGLVFGIIKKSKAPESTISQNINATSNEQQKLFNPGDFIKEEVTISTEIIEEGLKEMGVLVTQEYYFTQVEEYKNSKTFAMFTTTSSMIYSYDGVVAAGIDCTKISVDKDDEKKIVTITIPESTIQYVDIDHNSFKKYEENSKVWNRLDLDDYNASLVEFEKSAKEKAMEKDLLKKADESAKTMIMGFASALVSTNDYTIEVVVD